MFSVISRKAVFAMTAALLLFAWPGRTGAYSGVVEGVVKNSSGQPVPGAFVKLKNAERRLTFMVVSQAQGKYKAKNLPPGKYVVQGVGGEFQSDWSSPVEVSDAKPASLNVSLTVARAPALPNAWPGRLPGEGGGEGGGGGNAEAAAKLPEGEGKKIASPNAPPAIRQRA